MGLHHKRVVVCISSSARLHATAPLCPSVLPPKGLTLTANRGDKILYTIQSIVMKEITLLDGEAYTIPSHYRSIEQGIYRDLKDKGDTCFRMPIGFKLDEGECMQYPLEDILDEYYLHVSEFILSTRSYNAVVLAGELEDLQRAKCILGKKISY